jgi:hypothetical protein
MKQYVQMIRTLIFLKIYEYQPVVDSGFSESEAANMFSKILNQISVIL